MDDGKAPVYLYIDEAGKFDFSPKGSKYLIIMRRRFWHLDDLSSIKYDCLEGSLPQRKRCNAFEFHMPTEYRR